MHYKIPFDTTPFVTASIKEVVTTLVEAMLLVTLVVFIFLQSWRATLIPMLAVPVSVVGTFLGLLLLGFTINVLTLFALVLAIGIVVDDAIVVIENTERLMANEKLPARVAADRAIRQVAGALIAIVLVLCAVFVPVAFLGGVTGEMFKQFAVTLVIAVILSGIVALTLTPALCAILLKESNEGHTTGIFGAFNRLFERTTGRYSNGVNRVLGRPRVWIGVFVLLVATALVLWKRVPTGFIPTEDKGYFAIAMQLPDAASLQRTQAVIRRVEGFLHEEPSVRNVVAFAGLDVLTRTNQTNSATIFILLRPWDERGKDETIDAITQRINGKLFGMKDAVGFAFNLPEIPGLGATSGVETNLQNRAGREIGDFALQVQAFTAAVNKLPAVQAMTTTFRANVPQVYLDVDRATAKARGVNLTDLFSTLQTFLSTLYINDFNLYGRTYRVQAEAQQQFRRRPEDLSRLYVRGREQRDDSGLIAGPGGVPERTHAVAALQRVRLGVLYRHAQAGAEQWRGHEGDRPARRRTVRAAGRQRRLLGTVVPGTGGHRAGGAGLRTRPGDRLPRAGSAIRELVHSLRGAVRRALRRPRRPARYLAPRVAERHLLPGRPDHGGRARGEERDPDRRVRERDSKPRRAPAGGGGRGRARAVPAYPHDLLRLHSRRIAAGDRERSRRRKPAFARHRRVRGHAVRHDDRHLLHSALLPGHPRARGGESGPMIRRASALLLVALAGGCAVGPSYHPEEVVPATTKVGAARSSDSARAFFDSLAAARASDTLAETGAPLAPKAVLPDSLANLAWLDIFRDSTMIGLVRTAIAQNRDLQTAVGRIREFRAEVGIAKAPLFPTLAANGSVSTNQVVIGSFAPTRYDAFRVTADVAWELDFWGRTRRGVEAARADLASQEAAQRAVVLSW